MGYSVLITESAHDDLDKIYTYIATELCNPTAATDLADKVESCLQQLVNYPYSFEVAANRQLAKQGYRRIAINSYILLYLVDERDNRVIVARMFYGRQKYEDLI